MPFPPQDKTSLRRQFRAARHEIDDERRQLANRAINRSIANLCEIRRPSRIAAYLAFDGEPDIAEALTGLDRDGVEVYLPVITAELESRELNFRHWHASVAEGTSSELQRNSFGIHEPTGGMHCHVSDFDLMLIPLVAWDDAGGRLGMGAGFYDRALSGVAESGVPLRIGIAYQAQRAKAVPMTAGDVRLHGVITEKGLFTFGD